jgi:hypothetical protein
VSEQLKYKLLHFQQKPPANMWDEIDAALDDQQSTLSKKLYNYKEVPQVKNWEKIEEELNKVSKEKTIVTPFFGKLNYKLLTAAVLIIAVSIIAFLIVNDQSSTPENDVVSITPKSETSSPAEVPFNSDDVAITETPSTPSKKNNDGTASNVPRQNQSADKKATLNDARYTTLADDDGKLVRLSKKIFPVFDCAENSTAFLRKRCQENIESLQKQMASSIVSPAADFAGLLDMLKKLEENN